MNRQKYPCLMCLMIGLVLILSSCDFVQKTYTILKLQEINTEITPDQDVIFKQAQKLAEFSPAGFNEQSRLFYLCKVWGMAKYWAENNPKSTNVDVDEILLAAIPKIRDCQSKEMYCYLLSGIIDSIWCAPNKNTKNPYADEGDYTLISFNWVTDTICLNPAVSGKLNSLFASHSGQGNQYIGNKSKSGTIWIEEKDYDNINDGSIRLLALFRYWNIINYFDINKPLIKESWDKVLYEAIPRFQHATDRLSYHKEVWRLTAKLKDTHVLNDTSKDSIAFGSFRPNFRMQKVEGKFFVNSIILKDRNTESVRIGDEIVKIDGKDVSCLYDSMQCYLSGGNEISTARAVCVGIFCRRDPSTCFTFARGVDTIDVSSHNIRMSEIANEKEKYLEKLGDSVLYRWLNDTIAYLNLVPLTLGKFNRNYEPVREAKVLLLDLRGYPDNMIFLPLTDAMMPPNTVFGKCTYVDTRFPGMVKVKTENMAMGSNDYFKGRIVLLVNDWTMSFSEFLSMAIQTNPNCVTVGYSTAGADGNIVSFKFPGGIRTNYTSLGVYYPDMRQTQGEGIKIDHFVEPTIERIKSGRDYILEEAFTIALK